MRFGDPWNDLLRQIWIAPAVKTKKRRKPRAHRCEPLELRELLTTVNAESSGNALYISLSQPVNETVLVGYTLTTGDLGQGGSEQATESGTATFVSGTTAPVYTLSSDDGDGDPGATATAAIDLTTVTWYGYTAVSINSATAGVSVTETDPTSSGTVSVAISVTGSPATEGQGQPLDFTVNYSGLTAGAQISYSTSNGTATSPADYTGTSGVTTATAASGSFTVPVQINDDQGTGESSPVSFTLTASSSGVSNYGIGSITEDNNDTTSTVPTISILGTSGTEPTSGTSFVTFTVSISPTPLTSAASVDYSTVDGSATSPTDYDAVSGTLNFAINQTTPDFVVVQINDDKLVNEASPQDFYVTLTNPSGATLSNSQATGQIYEDTEPAISITGTSGTEPTVGTSVLTFAVNVTPPPDSPVSVDYNTVDGSATSPTDYDAVSGTLNFTAGQTSANITVTIKDDNLANEASAQDFYVTLTNPSGATLSNSQATGQIYEDNDTPPTVSVSGDETSEQPPSGQTQSSLTFHLTLSAPSQVPVTVDYQTQSAPGETDASSDYQGETGSVVFNPGDTSTQVIVPVFNDPADDPVESGSQPTGQEPNTTMSLVLTGVTAATLANNSAEGIIYDSQVPDNQPEYCTCTCGCGNVDTTVVPANGMVGGHTSDPATDADVAESEGTDPSAIIPVNDQLSPTFASANDVKVQFTFGTNLSSPIALPTLYYSPAGYVAGDTVVFAEQVTNTQLQNLASGRYGWTMTVTEEYPNSADDVTRTYTGGYNLLNLDSSPFGAGWSLQQVDRMFSVSEGTGVSAGVELADGSGNTFFFSRNADGSYTSPANAPGFSTLSAVTSNGTITGYTLTDDNKNVENFDANGLLTSKTDINGNTTSYAYTGGLLSSITDQEGRSTTFTYDSTDYGGQSMVSQITDIYGRRTFYTYAQVGGTGPYRVATITEQDPGDGEATPSTTFTYNSDGTIATVATADGTTTYRYGPLGGVSQITDPDGSTTKYSPPLEAELVNTSGGLGSSSDPAPLVNAFSIVGTQTDGDGNVTSFTTGQNGEITSETDALEHTTYTQYNAAGQPVQITAPSLSSGPDAGLANITTFQYDANGNLIQEVLPDGSTETWTYNLTFNEVTSFSDPMGRVTDYTLDPSTGNVLSMTQVDSNPALDRTTTYTYTPQPTGQGQAPGGLVATEIDPRGIKTAYSYNSHGLVTTISYAVGTTDAASVSYAYDSQDNLTSETDELGRTTTYRYDALGRQIETDSPPPDSSQPNIYPVTTDVYDALGRLIKQTVLQSVSGSTSVTAVTSYAYEPTGDESAPVEQVIEASGTTLATTLTYSYDGDDNLLSETDALGRVTKYEYDADNRQIARQDPSPADGSNNGTFNRQTANGPVTSVVYDALGNVIAQIDALGHETDNVYDLRGNLLSTTGPAPTSGAARPMTAYAYDADQEMVSQTNAIGGVTLQTYDDFGELIQEQDPSPDGGTTPGPITQYQYDADGNQVAVVDPDGHTIQYVYNNRNSEVEEIDPSPGGTLSSPTTQYVYDAAQELVKVIDPMNRVTRYAYNGDGERTATTAPTLTSGVSTVTLDSYDLEGNLISETTPNGATTTNAYDILNRLTSVTQPPADSGQTLGEVTSYTYNANSELTKTVDPLGRTQMESYDGLGRVTSETSFTGVTTSYTYDYLSEVLTNADSGGGQTANSVTNVYDALGRKTSSTDQNAGLTKYGYDLIGNMTSLTDSVGNTTSWQFDGLGRVTGELLPTGASKSYQYDAEGNLLQSVDGDGHTIQYQYDNLDRETSETWLAPAAVVITPTDSVQTIVMWHGATSGTWTLTDGSQTTSRLNYNASASDIQNALAALSNVGAGNVTVTGAGTSQNPWVVTFDGALAGASTPLLVADFSQISGWGYDQSDSGVTRASSPPGGFSQEQVVGYVDTAGNPVTGGDFTLSFNGQTTTGLPYNASPAQVQSALEALSTVGAGGVLVTGASGSAVGLTGEALYTINFTGALAGDAALPQIGIQSAGLIDSQGQTSSISLESWTVAAGQQAAPQGTTVTGVQQVVVTAAPGGTFALGFEGESTPNIPVGASAATLQSDLAALTTIGQGNVQVSGAGTWASPYLVSFVGALAGQPQPALTVTSPLATVNTVTTSYDAGSEVTSTGDNYSGYAYTYDGQGNVATVDNGGTPGAPHVVLSSQYDGMGNRTSLAATINGTADFINNYSYDALSRLTQIDQQGQTGGNAVAPKSFYFGLDAIGDITAIDRTNSVTTGPNQSGPAYSVLSYNSLGQLTGINHEYMGTSLDNLTYTYDPLERVSTFTSIDGTATYGYDPMSQLTSTTYTTSSGGHQPANQSSSFDTNGNRTSVNSTSTQVGTDNDVTNDGTFTFVYDGEGNVVSRQRISNAPANDYLTTFTWDSRDRLTDVDFYNNSSTLTEHVHYVYDVFGNLIERDVDPNGSGTYTQLTHYVWDGSNVALAFDGSGNLIARYVNGPNTSAYDQYFTTLAEEDVTSLSSQGVVTYDLLDNQGSLVDIVNSSGTLVDHLVYTPTGVTAYESNSAVSHLSGWQGGFTDAITGEEKFGARWYNAADAVWSSEDPLWFLAGGSNLTRSRENDPTNVNDPTGLIDIDFPPKTKTGNSPRNPTEKTGATYGHGPKHWSWGPQDGPFIAQRVTIEGTFTTVDGCGQTHVISWRETYIEVWSQNGFESESHKAGPRKPAKYLENQGNFKFVEPKPIRNGRVDTRGASKLTIDYPGGDSCEVEAWDFKMTATYEVASGKYGAPLENGKFYKSPNNFQITHATAAGVVVPNPTPDDDFESMQYPEAGTTVPGLRFPPPQSGTVFEDVDTWHFHWEAPNAAAKKEYKCSGYKSK